MEQPEGYEQLDLNQKPLYCKLQKSIYELKQSGRMWNQHVDRWLKEQELAQSPVNPCLCIHKGNSFFSLAIYVDDIIIVTESQQHKKQFVTEMQKKFKITDMGQLSWILGTKATVTPTSINISQDKYINDVLKKYNMHECKSLSTPCVPPTSPTNDSDLLGEEQQREFKSLVGSLIYAAVITRPDISFAIGQLSKKMDKPTVND